MSTKHMFCSREPFKLGPPPGPVADREVVKGSTLEEPSEVVKHRDLGVYLGWKETDWVRAAIKEGAPVNTPEEYAKKYQIYHTPLHLAVLNDFPEIVPILVEEGHADVNARAHVHPKYTPLHLAAATGNTKMVAALLNQGADPDMVALIDDPQSCIPTYHPNALALAKNMNHKDVVSMLEDYHEYQLKKLQFDLFWTEEANIPEFLTRPMATYFLGKVIAGNRWFLSPYLHVFDIALRTWTKLAFFRNYLMNGYALCSASTNLHLIGGNLNKGNMQHKDSSKVYTLDKEFKWEQWLPQLNQGRAFATSATFDSYVVVAGGWSGHGKLASIEVINTCHPSPLWYTICNLPVKCDYMQCAVTDDTFVVGVGIGNESSLIEVLLCDIRQSIEKSSDQHYFHDQDYLDLFWRILPEVPLKSSGLAFINGCLLAVAGEDNQSTKETTVYMFDKYKQNWKKISEINVPRRHSYVVTGSYGNRTMLFVVGGWGAANSFESTDFNFSF